MTITVQQIQYTTDPPAWHALARGLGLQPLPGGDDVWSEFAGDGVLAVHRVDTVAEERTEIVLLTDSAVALDDALGVAEDPDEPEPEHAASPSTTAGTRAIGSRRRRFTRT